MKKMLVLFTFVALLAFSAIPANAAATLYSFHFGIVGGGTYCDGLSVYLYAGAALYPKTLVDGVHFATNCGSNYSWVNGFKAGVSSLYQYSATGATMIVSDPEFGNGALGGQGQVWLVNTTYHTWIGYFSNGGSGEYVFNYGPWTNGVAPGQVGTKSASQR